MQPFTQLAADNSKKQKQQEALAAASDDRSKRCIKLQVERVRASSVDTSSSDCCTQVLDQQTTSIVAMAPIAASSSTITNYQ